MESVASSSSPADPEPPHRRLITPTQPHADRIVRALSHPLHLLHRSDTWFFVLGATGNVYTVNLAATPSCTCPDRIAPCKHILFVMIKVLGINQDDSCLWRRTLRPCQLNRLLGMPTSDHTLAGAEVREKFHQLFFRERAETRRPAVEIPDGATCPVCLEEIGREERVAACGTCKNPIHEECLLAWRRSNRPRRFISCVLCRARWRDVRAAAEQEKYLNLSAYNNNHVSEDHDMLEGERRCGD